MLFVQHGCYKLIDNTVRNVTNDLHLIYMLFIKLSVYQ